MVYCLCMKKYKITSSQYLDEVGAICYAEDLGNFGIARIKAQDLLMEDQDLDELFIHDTILGSVVRAEKTVRFETL